MDAVQEHDVLIIGQGLAGSTLAWKLIQLGQRPVVVDPGESCTATRVAAGLLTPITGKRLTINERWDELWPMARAFYRGIEQQTGVALLTERPSQRIFASEKEREVYDKRLDDPAFASKVRLLEELPAGVDAPLGGFELLDAARLDTNAYLDATRQELVNRDAFHEATIDPETDLRFDGQSVHVDRLGIRARCVVFCQGAVAQQPSWLASVKLEPAVGEVLVVELPGLVTDKILHRGVWLVPEGEGDKGAKRFRLGSTHRWDQVDVGATEAGREELLGRLAEFCSASPKVLQHMAAVRPTTSSRRPSFGICEEEPRVAWLNGLGAKGSLWAPWCADQLVNRLLS